MPQAEERKMDVPDDPQCQPQKIRIIHIGMGPAGLLTAHKARKMLTNYELVCYEKYSSIGGTWLESRYPGCACDIPAHTYTFPFDGNPYWSGFYAYAPEIQEYFLNFYSKHNLQPFAVFNTTVTGARWHDQEGTWHVQLRKQDGTTFEDKCNVLINGSGVFTDWKWPDIEGLHDFEGTLVHTARWPEELDWKDKRVAVIGTGSSGVQLVPKMAETAAHLTAFMRNCTYVIPPVFLNDVEVAPGAMNPAAAGKHQYTEQERQRFRDDPKYHLEYRTKLEAGFLAIFPAFLRGSPANLGFKQAMQEYMGQKLGDREDLKQRIIPTWSPGCRRLTPGEGYLESLIKPNVTCIFDEIASATPTGLRTVTGQHIEVDIVACATGYNIQYRPRFELVGIGGRTMQDQTEPELYASIAAPGMPNYFVIHGPRGNWGIGCALPSHETQVMYILQCCRKMQEDRIKSMHPKQNMTEQINKYQDAWHEKHSVWVEDCRSYIKNYKKDGRVQIWGGNLLHHLKFLKRPRYEHFEIEYSDPDNIFAFMGNGRTIGELKHDGPPPVPYIRNDEDAEWDIE